MSAQIPLSLDRRPVRDFRSYFAGPNQDIVNGLCSAAAGDCVVLSGPKSSGKTHLLSAFAGDREAGQYLAGTALKSIDPAVLASFHRASRVAFDDIDRLVGDPSWERALFIAFNEWRSAGACLVFSVTSGFSWDSVQLPDLRSRLQSGTRLRLRDLGDADNQQLLRTLASARNMILPEDVIRLMIRRLPRDTASLIQWLDRIAEESLRRKRRVSPSLVHSLIRES